MTERRPAIETKSSQFFQLQPQKLWPLVANLKRIGEWNPRISLSGTTAFNAEIRVTFKDMLAARSKADGPGRIVLLEPNRAIAWRIRIPFCLQIDESFVLTPEADGTRVLHKVTCSRLLAIVTRPWLYRFTANYLEAADRGLEDYVKSIDAQHLMAHRPKKRPKPPSTRKDI